MVANAATLVAFQTLPLQVRALLQLSVLRGVGSGEVELAARRLTRKLLNLRSEDERQALQAGGEAAWITKDRVLEALRGQAIALPSVETTPAAPAAPAEPAVEETELVPVRSILPRA